MLSLQMRVVSLELMELFQCLGLKETITRLPSVLPGHSILRGARP